MSPIQTGSLCAVSPTKPTLLCEDLLESGKIRWLDCSVSPPKQHEEYKTIESQREIYDMCCVESNGRLLLVMLTWSNKLYAFDAESGDLEWRYRDHLVTKLTTDGLGHLFVYDHEQKCILKLNADGQLLGIAVEKNELRNAVGSHEEQRFKIKSMEFVRSIPAIAFAYKSGGKYQICLVKI